MKKSKIIVSVFLCICMIITALPFATTAATDEYAQSLKEAGFPDDYIDKLCDLHDLHPTWKFIPDNITQYSREYPKATGVYTWDYVIGKETENDMNNIIWETYTDPAYSIDLTPVESGHWYRASVPAVKFFMDPRNFLNEYDIFQFEYLDYNESMNAELAENILKNTFMENTLIPGNPDSLLYSELIVDVARELDLSAVQIASRLRMEQGVNGTSPLISGKCGDKLWELYQALPNGYKEKVNGLEVEITFTESELKAFNGYYNYFNMEAMELNGYGYFEIYLNGMREAKKGGWTDRTASIRGGAAKFRATYIENYQYTPYYFKYNVHAGAVTAAGYSRNFWGQYMQAVSGAWEDGRTMQKGYRNLSLLDACERVFYIPVYEGMPAEVCTDPGNDFKNKQTYKTVVTSPISVTADTQAAYIKTFGALNSTLKVEGENVHTEGVFIYQYSIDGASYRDIKQTYSSAVAAKYPQYTEESDVNTFSCSIPLSGLSMGSHNIIIRGVSALGNRFIVADIDVDIIEAYSEIEVTGSENIILDKTDGTVCGIEPGTVASVLLQNLSKGKILDKDGVEITDGVLASGYKLCGYDSAGNLAEEYTVIVKNDVCGDGVINSKDIIAAKLVSQNEEFGCKKAVDIDSDGVISADEIAAVLNSMAG